MWWVMGAGLLIEAYGRYTANQAEAENEKKNAAFYKEQAEFARQTAERQRDIFDRESKILYGNQATAFAVSGGGGTFDTTFMAKTVLQRQQESLAIKKEGDMNVRLAMLRAEHSQGTADTLSDPMTTILPVAGSALTSYGKYMGGNK